MRFVASLLIFALACAGCSGGNPPPPSSYALPTLEQTSATNGIEAFAIAAPVAYSGNNPVLPLFELPQIPTNQGLLALTMWGTKDANGEITSVAQAEVSGISSGFGSVHIFFDNANHPILFRDDASGYAIAIALPSSTQQTITLCDPNSVAQAHVTLTMAAGVSHAGAALPGGSCVLANAASFQRRVGPANTLSNSGVATDVSNLSTLQQIITTGSYAAGFASALTAILKFKGHKDNPSQIPLGTPIALLVVAAALLFLPTILTVNGTIHPDDSLVTVDGALPFYMAEQTLPGCGTTLVTSTCVFPSPDPTP